MKLTNRFIKSNWPLLLILLLAGALLLYKVDKPFWGHHDWNGVYWGNIARNYVRYTLVQTKLASVDSFGLIKPPERLSYTFHYPPLFPLTLGAFFSVFGVHEWSARFMAIVFSLLTICVFYKLVRKYFDQKTATFTSLFWIATPMFIYFAKMPVHENEVLFFIILATFFYLGNRFLPMLIMIVLAQLTTWSGYFLVPAITLHWFFFRRQVYPPAKIVILWLISFLVFLSFMIYDWLVTGSPWGGGLAEIFFFRVHSVALIPYINLLARWLVTYFTPILLVFGVYTWVKFKSIPHPDILFLLFVFAIIYPIIFRDASLRHDYLLIYFWPFITLSAALGVDLILKKRERFKIPVALLAVILIIAMRFKFILALENSDIYRESVRFGKFINVNSKPSDRVLAITADPSVGFDGNFISFYADRQMDVEKKIPVAAGHFDKVFYYLPGGKIIQ